MSLKQSYAIWNNKGGVGKSTITFHLATRYAEKHPKRKVLVIDCCPQANSSMMLLGGGTDGENRVLELCQKTPAPPTVVGYLATVLSQGPGAKLPPWKDFVLQVSKYNDRIADNVYLLCGDGNLEPMAPLISERARQAALIPNLSPWKSVHMTLRDFINSVTCDETEWLVLVDTNPSFSIYTEIAICAADRLIVPVNADDASRVATNAMFTLIYGAEPPHPVYGQYTFAKRSDEEKIQKPIIHLVIGNRLTQYGGPATAFRAMSDATAESLFEAFKKHKDRFSSTKRAISSWEQFREAYSIPLRDFNTAGVISAHSGTPLSQMKDGTYQVHGESVSVKTDRLVECQDAIDKAVSRI